jgi:hypothetical protein
VETPRKFITVKLSIRKPGSSKRSSKRSLGFSGFKGKWQYNFLFSHLKELLKL